MPNLIDIRRRIKSVQNTQQITKAMKFVSAAKLKKAQDRIFGARPYVKKLFMLINHLASSGEVSSHPFLEEVDSEKYLVVLITGDRGLCGAFNANLIKAAYSFFEKNEEGELLLELIGKKGYEHFKKRNFEVFNYFVDRLTKVDMELAEEIAEPLINLFLEKRVGKIFIIYNEFKSVLQQKITIEQLLPITSFEFENEGEKLNFIFDQDPKKLVEDLFPTHVKIQIYHALLESVASEHGARMAAMDAATKNAEEMIKQLTLFRNRVRQASITKELIEIVSGANALK